MWLALLSAPALADDVADWQRLNEAKLHEALGDLPEAIAAYERLLASSGMTDDDPVRSRVLYRLGSARYAAGRTEAAKRALIDAVRTASPSREACLELLERIALDESSVRTVPTLWRFDDDRHGVVHPFAAEEKGRSVRIDPVAPGGDPALAWTTVVDPRRDDHLVVGLVEPTPRPRGVRFQAMASRIPAALRLVAYDTLGQRYVAPFVAVPTGEWTAVSVELRDLRDETGVRAERADLDRLEIRDATAFTGLWTGENTLWIDDFEVFAQP